MKDGDTGGGLCFCFYTVYQISLWRPQSDLQSLLKEGCRYRVYNLTTSDARKPGGSATVQLTGTKKTQFEHLQVNKKTNNHLYALIYTFLINGNRKNGFVFLYPSGYSELAVVLVSSKSLH